MAERTLDWTSLIPTPGFPSSRPKAVYRSGRTKGKKQTAPFSFPRLYKMTEKVRGGVLTKCNQCMVFPLPNHSVNTHSPHWAQGHRDALAGSALSGLTFHLVTRHLPSEKNRRAKLKFLPFSCWEEN